MPMKLHPMIALLLFGMTLPCSCSQPAVQLQQEENNTDPEENLSRPALAKAVWFAREEIPFVSGGAFSGGLSVMSGDSDSHLTYAWLQETIYETKVITIEQYTSENIDPLGTSKYAFEQRYYLHLNAAEPDGNQRHNIIGIKQRSQDGFYSSGDVEFESLIHSFGSAHVDISIDAEGGTLAAEFEDGTQLSFYRGYIHEVEEELVMEVDGVDQPGTYSERFQLFPMDQDFYLSYRWDFSYRADGASVNRFGSYSFAGSRTFEGTNADYLCVLESFPQFGAYPHYVFGEDTVLFQQRRNGIGFGEFRQKNSGQGLEVDITDDMGQQYHLELMAPD